MTNNDKSNRLHNKSAMVLLVYSNAFIASRSIKIKFKHSVTTLLTRAQVSRRTVSIPYTYIYGKQQSTSTIDGADL